MKPVFLDPVHRCQRFHLVHALPAGVGDQHDHRILALHLCQRNLFVQLHAGPQAGNVHDPEVAVHQQVRLARPRFDPERCRFDQANLALARLAFETVLSQMGQRSFLFQGKHLGRRRAILEQLVMCLVRINTID